MTTVLTRIRLNGFKTFAQRTEIELTEPLTAIVGPNGCGKSNLVDAILWALGETHSRLLRATTATEVLFNGSSTHKPMGLAEVSLWFNNETRWLPLEVDEVQITRRLYRSGEWECWINKTPARLRDLADLFAGTGLGRGGYAIVGQGDIEAFLNADPDERRRWIEEVAGITLYRQRRREALRDLESARMHLRRVEDVLRELERQREPLREQAERALLYRELNAQLTQLERQRLLYDWLSLHQHLRGLRAQRETLREQIIQTELLIGDHEQQTNAYGQQIAGIESQMDTLRTLLQGQMSTEERLLGLLHALHERERTLHELKQTLTDETHNLTLQETDALELLQQLETERQQALTELHATQEELQTATATLHHLARRKAELERLYQQRLQQQAQYEQAHQRRQAVQEQAQSVENDLQEARLRLHALTQTHQQAKSHEAQLQESVQHLEHAVLVQERDLQGRLREAQNATRQREALRARVHALTASVQAGEGAHPAVRSLLQAVRKGELQGEFYPVASVLSVPRDYLTAIHSALGGALHDLITPTEAEAKQAVEWLKRQRAGRLTFLPLDLLQPLPIPTLPFCEGVIGLAYALVEYDSRFHPAIQHLLGRVVIVDTLENGIALLRTLRQRSSVPISRIVSLEGEVLNPSGTLTGGAFASERQNLLHLKAELDATLQQLAIAERESEEAERALETARTLHQQLHEQLQAERTRLRHATQARLQTENELKLGHQAIQNLEQRLQQLRAELEQLTSIPEPTSQHDLQALTQERTELDTRYEQALQHQSELRARMNRLQSLQDELQARLKTTQAQLQQVRERQRTRSERLQSLEQELSDIARQRAQHQAALEVARARIADLQAQLETLRTERHHLLEASFALTDKVRTYRHHLQTLAEQERGLELQIARTEVKLSDLQENWQRLFPDEPLPTPEETPPVRAPVSRAEIEKLRRALLEMGEVNLGATEEYARLTERYNTLDRQRTDLEATCAQLTENLRALDTDARTRFETTFQQVSSAFQERFRSLFEGGQAELILTDAQDPLSAGVIVEVQPPGKRRQRLELLSGGERALTALAMLFALTDVRPSPLYILDEVDAALDGRNVQRFAEHLKSIAQNTQVLIVTHNPITTAVAQQWLGISMTGGVSRVVPYTPRLTPEASGSSDSADGTARPFHQAVIAPQSQPTPKP